MFERLKQLLKRLKEWGNRENITIQIFNIRQTRNGTAFEPFPLKIDCVVIGEEVGDIVETAGCFRVTHHPSWYKTLVRKEHFEHCKVKKQLVQMKGEEFAILLTSLPEINPP